MLLCGAQLQLLPQTAVVAFSTTTNNVPPSPSTATTRNNVVGLPRYHGAAATTTALASTKSSTTSTDDAALLTEIRNEIVERGGEDELRTWEECVQILSDLFQQVDNNEGEGGGEGTIAELYLSDAYRWKAWATASETMRKYQKPTLPAPDALRASLAFLAEKPLQLTPSQIIDNIQKYPQIYLREPQASYKKVLGSAPRKYRSDETLKRFIEHDPNVLQVTFNCDGEGCQSECGSCWVSYENRLPKL